MFLWRQEDTSSLRLFSVDSSGRQMIRNFSLRQRLHLLLELLYGECDERMRQEIKCSMLLSLRVQMCFLLKRGAMKRGENMHGSLSDDIICSKMRTVFQRAKSEENYELREQVMSKDKYTDIFSRQMEAIAFIILKIFCNAREKCLRTAYCLLRGTFSFEFSGTTLWTNKYFPSSE